MNPLRIPTQLIATAFLLSSAAIAQHSQVSAVAVDPSNPRIVWVCNRTNHSVSVVDTSQSPAQVTEIQVGIHPRSLAFNADGSRVFVANQRGTVSLDVNFVTPFAGTELRGSLDVIDTQSLQVVTTLAGVGVEPYGVAVAPNGKWFAVSGFRSGTIKIYDASSLQLLVEHQYLRDLNFIPDPFTIADADANRDGIADFGDPRGFVIRSDSARMYVTHHKSSHISVLDVALDANGIATGIAEAAKIDTNEYPLDTFFNTDLVQELKSQGVPRFLEDIALTPDGTRALVPHVLHNINHDVNHDFGPALAGDALNRVYPALSMIDATANSFDPAGPNSARLHHELSDDLTPAEYAPYGDAGISSSGDHYVLGGEGTPKLGGIARFVVSGLQPGDTATLLYGNFPTNMPFAGAGTLLVRPRFMRSMPNGVLTIDLPDAAVFADFTAYSQALITLVGGPEQVLTNGLRFHLDFDGFDPGEMGYRAGQPSRVAFNAAGDHAVLLNRGSEDVFLYSVDGDAMQLRGVFPPRLDFQPRAALDTTTPMGDLPLGMALIADTTTLNDDALIYVINETTRTLSTLRVDFEAGVIAKELDQITTVLGPDEFTLSERIGQELFEDASRPQTAGNFNNSCASCHFEGGEDGNIWQRPAGPRSTMPVYGGTLGTGLILWKGVRLNMGETGPMFGGENGGTGVLTDAEQQGLVDYHEQIPFPLNPNLDPITGDYSTTAALGKDLFFGSNDTGLNPTGRHAGCAECHPDVETNPNMFPGPRFYTSDFVNPLLSGGEALGNLDPTCFSLRENLVGLNVRNVNTGANVDDDGDGTPDIDRNNDGYVDLETYGIMNIDTDDDFKRDDGNSYLCPCTPGSFNCDTDGMQIFTRPSKLFSIPTKLGVFSTPPYFHDHSPYSLRAMLNPETQSLDLKYGNPAFPGAAAYPGLNKIFNEEHDVIGHEDLGGISDVQLSLQSTDPQADMEAILSYVLSL